jgi:hypothetical protein
MSREQIAEAQKLSRGVDAQAGRLAAWALGVPCRSALIQAGCSCRRSTADSQAARSPFAESIVSCDCCFVQFDEPPPRKPAKGLFGTEQESGVGRARRHGLRQFIIRQDGDGRWSLSFDRATVGPFSCEDDAIALARNVIATGAPAEVLVLSGGGDSRVVWKSSVP